MKHTLFFVTKSAELLGVQMFGWPILLVLTQAMTVFEHD